MLSIILIPLFASIRTMAFLALMLRSEPFLKKDSIFLIILFQGGEDAGAGEAVAVGVDGVGHAGVGFGVVDEGGDFADDAVVVGADEADGAGGEGFGAFGGVAHHEDGLAEAGGFFLNAAAVGEDDGGFFHEEDERQVFEGLDEVHVAEVVEAFAEHFVDGAAHVGIEVHRVDEVDVGIFLCQALDGAAHADEAVAEVFAAVAGDEHEASAVFQPVGVVAAAEEFGSEFFSEACVVPDFVDHPVEGVDDGVAGDGDGAVGDVFFEQVFAAEGGGREVVGGDASRQLAVHLFGPRAVDVVGAESCFDVSDGYLPVECGEGCGGAGGGVAVDEHYVGGGFREHVAHADEHAGGDIVEVLTLLHDVEVVVGGDVEDGEHLVEHLAVLSGDADDGLERVGVFLELFDERCHLDGFRACPEDEHYLFHVREFS